MASITGSPAMFAAVVSRSASAATLPFAASTTSSANGAEPWPQETKIRLVQVGAASDREKVS
ncbi:MAG TPA: hypothetical protein VFO90_08855 [Terrimicrobiaceae bacterium]|nr:hypothetical protein [Terrimicrobiaceae bacterium]